VLQPPGPDDLLHTGGEDGLLRAVRRADDLRVPLGPRPEPAVTERAWTEFHARIRGFVSRRVRHGADADDIVQRVFLEMHRRLETLRARDRLAPWLYRTARNAVIDHYRSPVRRREVPSGDTRDLADARQPVSAADEEDARTLAADCVRPMLVHLPAAHRRAIELVELQGVTQTAAARVEGLSVSGMKTRVQRARRQLKASLLECCRIELDRRGGVMGCETRGGTTRSSCRSRNPRKE
jgi:RNA polymerase sigma-70 factor (ECF subfamily)